MKVIQIMMYFIILNGVFIMLSVAGIYPTIEQISVDQDFAGEDFTDTGSMTPLLRDMGFTALITGAAVVVAVGIGTLAHQPFAGLSYGLMVGLFIDAIRKIFGIFANLADSIGPQASSIFISLIAIFAVVVIFLFINGLRQMGTGGDRGND